MEELKMVKRGTFLLALGLAVVVVTPARAGVAACVTPQQTLVAAVVGAGDGCSYQNAEFLTFNVGTEAGAGGATFPTPATGATANIEFAASGTPVYTLAYQTTGQNATGAATCAANSWCANGNSSDATQTITEDATTTLGKIYSITLSDGTVGSDATIRAGDIITVDEQYCVGGASIASCTSADLGFIKIVQTTTATGFSGTPVITVCEATVTGGACTAVASTLANAAILGGGATSITIADTVTMTTIATEDHDIFLDSFDNTFSTLPEPSTFILFGSALAGLVAFRSWKRKQQS
jgi:hypothetical protein